LLLENDKTEIDFSRRRAIFSYLDDELIGGFYVETFDKKSLNRWVVRCLNVVDLLSEVEFIGDVYEEALVSAIVSQLSASSGVSILLDDALVNERVSGWLGIVSVREALVQIAFAIGGIIKVNSLNEIAIVQPSVDIKYHFDENRCKAGVSLKLDRPTLKEVILRVVEYIKPFTSDRPQRLDGVGNVIHDQGWEQVGSVGRIGQAVIQ
jgi:hypothetical protein